jgi:hypothetical protein
LQAVNLCSNVSCCPQLGHSPVSCNLILFSLLFVGIMSCTIIYHIVLMDSGKNFLLILFNMTGQVCWGNFVCIRISAKGFFLVCV